MASIEVMDEKRFAFPLLWKMRSGWYKWLRRTFQRTLKKF